MKSICLDTPRHGMFLVGIACSTRMVIQLLVRELSVKSNGYPMMKEFSR